MKAVLTVRKSLEVGVPSPMSISVLGTSGEHINSGSFRVAFGDGTEHVGTPLSFDHIYSYPGTYVVQFVYKANDYSDSAPEVRVRINVEVIQTSVSIKVNKDGSVTLANTGTKEADLSNWRVQSLSTLSDAPFVLPSGTVLLAGKSMTLPLSVTHIPQAHTSIMAITLPTGVVSSFDISQYTTQSSSTSVKGITEEISLVQSEQATAVKNFEHIEKGEESQISATAIDAFEDLGIPESPGMILVFIFGMLAILAGSVLLLRRVVLRADSPQGL